VVSLLDFFFYDPRSFFFCTTVASKAGSSRSRTSFRRASTFFVRYFPKVFPGCFPTPPARFPSNVDCLLAPHVELFLLGGCSPVIGSIFFVPPPSSLGETVLNVRPVKVRSECGPVRPEDFRAFRTTERFSQFYGHSSAFFWNSSSFFFDKRFPFRARAFVNKPRRMEIWLPFPFRD